MQDMSMTSMSAMVMAPQWLTMGLGAAFLCGAVYYLFRLCNPAYLTRLYGYADAENEFWHGTCLLAMVTMLTPRLVSIPNMVWVWVLPVGCFWYLLRSVSWGRRKPHNKLWYDLAHAAMFFGMWWMYAQPLSNELAAVHWAFVAYWGWFGSYYVVRLLGDLWKASWLAFWQDVFHLGMAVCMVVMTIWPTYLMAM
jgi:hypothetical protein